MRDEHKDDQQYRRLDMPLISFPTETIRTHAVRPNEQPPSVTMTSSSGVSDFRLGIDTCGFTTSSTITCGFGSECTNVGDYRGCCSAGSDDCISTIYTDCINYGDSPDNGECGDHTLCCPYKSPYCFTYAFTTAKDPDATFTFVECNPTNGFGEMFPFPPELTMKPENSATDSPTPTPTPTSSHSSVSPGAIAGVAIGGAVFLILVIVAAILLIRYRRRQNQAAIRAAASIPPGGPMVATPHSSTEISPTAEKQQAQAVAAAAAAAARDRKTIRRSLLRPLSMIREQQTPTPTPPSPPARKHKSAAPATTTTGGGGSSRLSFGPNWPLGPASSSNPLGAHPVDANLKKRLSDSRVGTRGFEMEMSNASSFGSGSGSSAETLRVPPVFQPPPPGTRPAGVRPAFPPPRKKSHSTSTVGSSPPPSAGSRGALQSPAVKYVPVSPIEARVGVQRSGSLNSIGVGGNGSGAASMAANLSKSLPMVPPAEPEPEPVSPIESDEEEEEGEEGREADLQRFSYVSAPSAHGAGDDLVSPVTPYPADEDEDEEGEADGSMTVSPLESPRGSVDSLR
ncbi:hypothetical protein M426DRAFT_262152 [Hypoxylon sp. CI-4A]|nr:hypothetical protein M426DRAFT_262152 [Hypoxylon sp. CI-4A]